MKSGGNFYFQSVVCIKTTRTASGRATYVGNTGFKSYIEDSLLALQAFTSLVIRICWWFFGLYVLKDLKWAFPSSILIAISEVWASDYSIIFFFWKNPVQNNGKLFLPIYQYITSLLFRMVPELCWSMFGAKLVRYCLYMWLPMYLSKGVKTCIHHFDRARYCCFLVLLFTYDFSRAKHYEFFPIFMRSRVPITVSQRSEIGILDHVHTLRFCSVLFCCFFFQLKYDKSYAGIFSTTFEIGGVFGSFCNGFYINR